MTEIATPGQLRMSYLRWALVTVPAIVLLGAFTGGAVGGRWFDALDLPAIAPQDWVFRLVPPLLFLLEGFALAMLLHARGARGRAAALLLFILQLFALFAWTPLFFGRHQVTTGLYVALLALALTIAVIAAAAPIRRAAAWLLAPSLLWLAFLSLLNFQIDQRNPDAEKMGVAVPAASTQIGSGKGPLPDKGQ